MYQRLRVPSRCELKAAVLTALCLLTLASPEAKADYEIGVASNYALLFEGGGGNTLQITNVSTNTAGTGAGQGGGIGNIGVGGTGLVTVSGPSHVNGRIDITAANTGQFSNNNGGNTFINGSSTPTVNYSSSLAASALSTVNALNSALGAVNGTGVSINGNTTINANTAMLASGNGFSNVEVFNVSSFSLNNGQTLTIVGDGHDVVFNFTSSTNFHGNVALAGGLTPDNVLFNFVGGSKLTGGPTLDINNGGGSPSNSSYLSQGIFLDPNGAVSVVNSNVLGRVFGGDSHDFQYVSGSNITAPMAAAPAPPTVVLLGSAAALVGGASWLRRRPNRLVAPTPP